MKRGDAVVMLDWDGNKIPYLFGIILDVHPDLSKLKSAFGTPWIYRVLWNDRSIKEHESGTGLRRIFIYEPWR